MLGADIPKRQVLLADCHSWAPPPGGQVNIDAIKATILDAHHRFGLACCYYDPWQCEYLASQLSTAGVPMLGVPFTSKNLDLMATSLLSAFNDERLRLYREPALIRDLLRLQIVERTGRASGCKRSVTNMDTRTGR